MNTFYGFFVIFVIMISSNNGNSTIHLDYVHHLDDYSLLCIFDFLDLEEMANMALINERFYEIITNHYMIPLFRIHENIIRLAIDENPTETPKLNTIVIKNNQTIHTFLRTFGHLISSIQYVTKLSTSPNMADLDQITDYITEHCSETLITLELNSQTARLTISSSKVFKKLTKLKLEYWIDFENMNINRIFPVLEELTIDTPHPIPESMGHFYSKLQRLNLLTNRIDASDAAIKKLLRLNPQLRALSIQGVPSFTLLKFMSEISVNLESLSIGYKMNELNSSNGEKIHFENLKSFSLHSKSWFEQAHEVSITFRHLENLEISSQNCIPSNLLKENFELKSISLPLANAVTAFEMLMQAGPIRRLEELKIQWSNDFSFREMTDKFPSLERIIFIVHEVRGNEQRLDAITGKIRDDWHVIDHKSVGIDSGIDIYHVIATRE